MFKKLKQSASSSVPIIFNNMQSEEYWELYPPKPASHFVPDWYKNTPSYINNEKNLVNETVPGTIKKCMPVFDSITNGYILTTTCDIEVTTQEYVEDGKIKTRPYFAWKANFNAVLFHPIRQNPNYGIPNGHESDYPKFNNFWSVITPKGYSTLITQPFHRSLPFTIFPAVVDTDIYTSPITFPFILNDITWKGIIPAGTPIAQIMPFKREKWEMSLNDKQTREETKVLARKIETKIYDAYKNIARTVKEYK